MAQSNEEALHRTDANEVRFHEAVPDDQKFIDTQHSFSSSPKGQDTGFHVDKLTSVTETGYGGVSGRGNDVSGIVQEARENSPRLGRRGEESFTDKAKDVVYGVKDLATGKKQQDASVPVADQSAVNHTHAHKEGVGEKPKDCVTGQKPGRGSGTSEGTEEWPLHKSGKPNSPSLLDPTNTQPRSATYTDPQGCPVEGPRDDNTKKEGVMSKVMDKFNLGTNKDSAQ